MSVPNDILRYAGVWNSTSAYQYGMFVQSSLVNNSFVLVVASLTGGSDPSVPSANWVAFPVAPSGDITSIVAGTGISGGGDSGVVTVSNDGVLSLNNLNGQVSIITSVNDALIASALGNDVIVEYAGNSKGIYTSATGTSPTATITAGCVAGWLVLVTYIHAGGGGGTQYINNVTVGNGSFTVTCNTNIDVGDQILWHVIGRPN
jgi:hypothetical protein